MGNDDSNATSLAIYILFMALGYALWGPWGILFGFLAREALGIFVAFAIILTRTLALGLLVGFAVWFLAIAVLNQIFNS